MNQATLIRIYRAIQSGMGCSTAAMLAADLKLAPRTVQKVIDSGILTQRIEYNEGMEGCAPPVALTPNGSKWLKEESAYYDREVARKKAAKIENWYHTGIVDRKDVYSTRADGGAQPWLTKREARALSKRDGKRAVFVH